MIQDLPPETRRQRLAELGAALAHAFDEVDARAGFIDTQERDELLDGVANLVSTAPTAEGVDRQAAADTILHAINQTRDW